MDNKLTDSINFVKTAYLSKQLVYAIIFFMTFSSIFPHGTVTYPPSRIWNCFQEDPESPDSAPCIAAVASHGTQALYDWNEINQANANGDHRRYIMDGNLASGGRPDKYGGMDQVRSDWVSTAVSPGPFTVTWTNYAPHATAYYEVYITKESWSPDQPLTWDSLVLLVRTPPSGAERVVNIPVTLPVRTGKHVIYSIWQRSDSAEAFYSTSDIHFDGGTTDTQAPSIPENMVASGITQTTVDLSWNASTDNTAVVGYDIYQGNSVVATATGTSYQVTGLTENTSYSFKIKAKDAANNQSDFSNVVTIVTLPDQGGGNCTNFSEWSATMTYYNGDDVKYKNVHYKAKWWTRNENPENNSGTDDVWKKIGNCTGSGNNLPSASITSPANNSVFDEGSNIVIQANATDSDGIISKVAFFSNDIKLGESSTAPYEYTMTNVPAGTYLLSVKAIDDKGGYTVSDAITIKVQTSGGGNCTGIPDYIPGGSYSNGDEVQNAGGIYICDIPGWCSSPADWAYAPGTGQYWQHAWSKTGDCNLNLFYSISPVITNNMINLKVFGKSSSIIKTELYNFTGKLLSTQMYRHTEKSIIYDLSDHKKGLYILKIYAGNKIYTEKILKK